MCWPWASTTLCTPEPSPHRWFSILIYLLDTHLDTDARWLPWAPNLSAPTWQAADVTFHFPPHSSNLSGLGRVFVFYGILVVMRITDCIPQCMFPVVEQLDTCACYKNVLASAIGGHIPHCYKLTCSSSSNWVYKFTGSSPSNWVYEFTGSSPSNWVYEFTSSFHVITGFISSLVLLQVAKSMSLVVLHRVTGFMRFLHQVTRFMG